MKEESEAKDPKQWPTPGEATKDTSSVPATSAPSSPSSPSTHQKAEEQADDKDSQSKKKKGFIQIYSHSHIHSLKRMSLLA